MSEVDPLLAAVEPHVDTYEREETLDRWIGVLPDGTEYYGADTLEGLYEYETEHRQAQADHEKWMLARGSVTKVPVPLPFVEVLHRIIHTVTVTTTVRAETRHPRAEETR